MARSSCWVAAVGVHYDGRAWERYLLCTAPGWPQAAGVTFIIFPVWSTTAQDGKTPRFPGAHFGEFYRISAGVGEGGFHLTHIGSKPANSPRS